jgi:hypothetical protein
MRQLTVRAWQLRRAALVPSMCVARTRAAPQRSPAVRCDVLACGRFRPGPLQRVVGFQREASGNANLKSSTVHVRQRRFVGVATYVVRKFQRRRSHAIALWRDCLRRPRRTWAHLSEPRLRQRRTAGLHGQADPRERARQRQPRHVPRRRRSHQASGPIWTSGFGGATLRRVYRTTRSADSPIIPAW